MDGNERGDIVRFTGSGAECDAALSNPARAPRQGWVRRAVSKKAVDAEKAVVAHRLCRTHVRVGSAYQLKPVPMAKIWAVTLLLFGLPALMPPAAVTDAP